MTARRILPAALVLAVLLATSILTVQHIDAPHAVAVPAGSVFGLNYMRGVVQSPYAYEAGLLDYEPPNADTDYLLNYAVHEVVSLPGGRWDHYTYLGAIYVQGSGTVMKFLDPHRHHFALLHMSAVWLRGPSATAPPLPRAGRQLLSDGEETALAAAAVHLPTASLRIPGGTAVGTSGWPSSYQYSNGSCGDEFTCRGDAHLCLLTSAGSWSWFWYVASGHDHPPPTFPRKRWGRTNPYDRHHHLIYAASWTWHHHATWLYPYRGKQRWNGPTARRKYGYMVYTFAHGKLRCWTHYSTCKASKT